jgi:hypothetical protein
MMNNINYRWNLSEFQLEAKEMVSTIKVIADKHRLSSDIPNMDSQVEESKLM